MSSYRERQRQNTLTGQPLPRRDRMRESIAAGGGYALIPGLVVLFGILFIMLGTLLATVVYAAVLVAIWALWVFR